MEIIPKICRPHTAKPRKTGEIHFLLTIPIYFFPVLQYNNSEYIMR